MGGGAPTQTGTTGAGVLDTPSGALAGYTPPQVTPGESVGNQIQAAWQEYQNNPNLQASIQQEYGDESWAMSIPELAQVIVAGALYGWDQGEMDGAISNTQWYKTTSATARSWLTLQQTDPATAQQTLDATKWSIWQISQETGVALTPTQTQNLAQAANLYGWVDATGAANNTLTQIIINQYANPTSIGSGGTTQMGTAATFTNQARQLSGDYLVPMSDQAIQQWAIRAVKGQTNVDGLTDYLRQQASQLYPWMTPALNQGFTAKDYLSPYAQAAATTLGVSPDSVDFTNPKWMGALTSPPANAQPGTPVQAGAVPGINNVDQFTRNLKQDPTFGYQYTQDAMNQAYSMAQTIEQTFGKIAT